MSNESFEQMLTGGHPNSLGRTIEVVEIVLADQARLEELYRCYFSEDEVVRLRTSNGLKRVAKVHLHWLVPYIGRFLDEITPINQASTQWTLADLFGMLSTSMNETQRARAEAHLKHNLATHDDWIVLNSTMKTLGEWGKRDEGLRHWLMPHLERLSKDKRKSVAKRAGKLLDNLT